TQNHQIPNQTRQTKTTKCQNSRQENQTPSQEKGRIGVLKQSESLNNRYSTTSNLRVSPRRTRKDSSSQVPTWKELPKHGMKLRERKPQRTTLSPLQTCSMA